jgi:hypothetical protein
MRLVLVGGERDAHQGEMFRDQYITIFAQLAKNRCNLRVEEVLECLPNESKVTGWKIVPGDI